MWYVYADPGGIGCIGVRARPGGAVFDAFEHPGDDEMELLTLAEVRNSPMRVETFDQGCWQADPENYQANSAGYRDALAALSCGGHLLQRLVTRGGSLLAHRSRTSRPPQGQQGPDPVGGL